jgi:hypothetical protein
VPKARALWVDRLGWRFTDPFMHELFSNNLEIHVNGQRLPWYRDGGVDVDPVGPPVPVAGASLSPVGFQYPFGSIAEPMPISTIYVDSGSLFEVRLVGGGDYVGVSVRVIGRLRKVAGGMT